MLEATGGARSGCQKWVPEWTLDGGSHDMGRVDWRIGGLADWRVVHRSNVGSGGSVLRCSVTPLSCRAKQGDG